ncbi:MAG: hypothetical protein JXR05_05245 [Flavobacteriaceae bacterium]
MKTKLTTLPFYCLIFLLISSCTSLKEVTFKDYVDTTTKPIKLQTKKVFAIEQLDVFASNEFDGARLNNFTKLNDSTVVAYIEPENTPINNSAYFAFDIWSSNSRSIYIKFEYPSGFSHRYHPKIKRNNSWSILDSSLVVSSKNEYLIKLNINSKKTTVAAQKVHSSSKVKSWYTKIAKENKSLVTLKKIGKSRLGRDLAVLDIYSGSKKNKPIIVLFTRQHPPEVTGYFAFQEFVKTIISDPISSDFLNKYRILAFPLLNPDGVDLGHWRHNAGGVDTNRDWSKYNQPEIKQVIQHITKQSKSNNAKIILGLDFHSTWYDIFYTNKKREGTSLPNFITDWFNGLEKEIPNYKVNEASGNSTKPVSKGWFLYGLNATGITYEIGDETPLSRIHLIGKTSAQQMMQILLKK